MFWFKKKKKEEPIIIYKEGPPPMQIKGYIIERKQIKKFVHRIYITSAGKEAIEVIGIEDPGEREKKNSYYSWHQLHSTKYYSTETIAREAIRNMLSWQEWEIYTYRIVPLYSKIQIND